MTLARRDLARWVFAAVSVVWGVPYFFIKVAVDDGVPPVFLAWSRVAIAAAILLPLALRSGALRGLAQRRAAIVAYAACEIVVPFTLISIGEQHVSSSLTAILIATMPLMVALLALRFTAEAPLTRLRVAGPADRPRRRRRAGRRRRRRRVRAARRRGADPRRDARLRDRAGDRRSLLADLDPLGPVTASLGLATLVLAPAALFAPPDDRPPSTPSPRS